MGILNALATSSFEPAHNGRQVSVIYPDTLKGQILLVRPLGLNVYPGYRRFSGSSKNWYRARARSTYKIVSIDGLNQTYEFLEREKNAGVSEDRIRIFFNGHVQKCDAFRNAFPKENNLNAKKFLFMHHNEI